MKINRALKKKQRHFAATICDLLSYFFKFKWITIEESGQRREPLYDRSNLRKLEYGASARKGDPVK